MSAIVASFPDFRRRPGGAPIVKGLLESTSAASPATSGGMVIDNIAAQAVSPRGTAVTPSKDLGGGPAAAEAQAPSCGSGSSSARGQPADAREMEKSGDSWWTWAWRPAGMWIFIALFAWYAAGLPIVNFLLGLLGTGERLGLIVDVSTMVTMFMFFAGFYMGGHTVKDFATKARDAGAAWGAK